MTSSAFCPFRVLQQNHVKKILSLFLLQIGGNDQTGNIMAGHDLIGRVSKEPVFGKHSLKTSGKKLAIWHPICFSQLQSG